MNNKQSTVFDVILGTVALVLAADFIARVIENPRVTLGVLPLAVFIVAAIAMLIAATGVLVIRDGTGARKAAADGIGASGEMAEDEVLVLGAAPPPAEVGRGRVDRVA